MKDNVVVLITDLGFDKFNVLNDSNAIKFTHEGKVEINLYVVTEPSKSKGDEHDSQEEQLLNGQGQNRAQMNEEKETRANPEEAVVWIRCDVYDTGIGIPGTLRIPFFVF